MKILITREISASADALWHALINPDILKACLPGCRSFVRVDDARWGALLSFKVGTHTVDLTAKIEIVRALPPESYTLSFTIDNPAVGSLHGTVDTLLIASNKRNRVTQLHYSIDMQPDQRLKKINPLMLETFAKSMTEVFLNRLLRLFRKKPAYATSSSALRAPPFSWVQQPAPSSLSNKEKEYLLFSNASG